MTRNNVIAIGEATGNHLMSPAKETIAVGRRLADNLGSKLIAIVPGGRTQEAAREAIAYGADSAQAVEDPLLADPSSFEAHVKVLGEMCNGLSPKIVLLSKTLLGREIAPRLAFRLGTSLANDCIALSIEPNTKNLEATRPVYGGNAIATILCQGKVQVASIRPSVFDPLEPDHSRQGEITVYNPNIDVSSLASHLVDRVREESQGVRLEDAFVVVSGGRGLGAPEAFQHVERLATILGGAMGCSRAVCDAGWLPPTYQVGLTGKTISPNLYIAIGISGASQHMAGCSGAKCIVAINKDGNARIFQEARYGVVGNWEKVLSGFADQISELLN